MAYNTVQLDFDIDGGVQSVIIELDPESAPNHVANFKKLVTSDFYVGLAVHRAIPDYLIQTGDPRSRNESSKPVWGLGGPGYTLPAEIRRSHQRGSLAAARLGNRLNPLRQSNGSQFYIANRALREFDGEYTVFGQVTRGMEVIDAISRVSTDENDVPIRRVTLVSASLIPGETPVSEVVLEPETRADIESDGQYERRVRVGRGGEGTPPPTERTRESTAPQHKGFFRRTLDRLW
jgi:cyclophilin family peptidyl-prolyl cis-trans isomerase